MNSRKRQAQEPLLPVRLPKQPRRTLKGYDGGAPSPSEHQGILARYRRFGLDAVELLVDTVVYFIPTSNTMSGQRSEAFIQDEITSSSSLSSASSVSTPPQTPSPDVKVFSNESDGSQGDVKSHNTQVLVHSRPEPSEPKITSLREYLASRPSAFVSNRNTSDTAAPTSTTSTPPGSTSTPPKLSNPSLLENYQSTPKQRLTSNTPMRPQWISSSSNSLEPIDHLLKNDVVPTMENLQLNTLIHPSIPSSQLSNTSILFSTSQRELSHQSSRRSSTTSKRNPLRHRNREHIFSKVHKANVQRGKQELREELTRQLYQLKRRSGFTSGFSDFKGLLDYQRQLQNINLENAPRPLHPSSSFATPLAKARTRRETLPDDVDNFNNFLTRALDNAKATLNSPKPPKPFLPTFDQLQISHRAKDEAIERRLRPVAPPLPTSLPPQDDAAVSKILHKQGVVSKFAREQVSDQDISRLRPGQWLNDEIVNFYGAMILGRSEASKENPGGQVNRKKPTKAPLNVHYFSSFFWAKLTKEGYEKGRLAKWTKKIDIFSKDVILIPVNHSNAHWTAAAINFRQKRVESYDSMGMAKEHVFKHLRSYLDAEHSNKKKKPFDWTGWENWAPDETPQQENGYDCGVFTCHFLEALSRGEGSFSFTQKDMPYLRRRMIWEIGNAQLRGGHYS